MIASLRNLGFRGKVAVSAHEEDGAEEMRAFGADLVLMPYRDAASQAAFLVRGEAQPSQRAPVDPEGQKEFAS